MPSDASLPPNAPTTLRSAAPTANGSLTPTPQLQPRSHTLPVPAPAPDHTKAVHSVDGEADASSEFLDDEHDGAELDVPPNPVPLREVCADVHARVAAFLEVDSRTDRTVRQTQQQVRGSLDVIQRALEEYGFEHLSLSYNGGKDCLVLLLLYLSVLHTHLATTPPTTPFPTSIPSIYATPPDPFPAVTAFVARSTASYHLSLTHIRTNPPPHAPTPRLPTRTFRDAFALYLAQHPAVTAIFVGTRRTDPHGATLAPFAHTDGNWPAFMRVHPVLEWGLTEIWCFLRHAALRAPTRGKDDGDDDDAALEYCAMYDEGYTSLGGRGDTVRNPRLRDLRADGTVAYRPAWMMVEDGAERAGRE